jgi:hypothetical protein
MARAYIRVQDLGDRGWTPIGWYCRFCRQLTHAAPGPLAQPIEGPDSTQVR